MAIYGSFTLPMPETKTVKLTSLTKTSLETTDQELLDTILEKNNGDIAVITTTIDDETINISSYMWNGNWVALNGTVEADKVVLTENITMAGNYTQVGNLTKTQTGTATFETKGLTVAEALEQIFSKRLQPSITAQPSLGNVTLSQSGLVEAGTSIASITVNAVTFNSGSYTYGPSTGVTVSQWKTERVSNLGEVNIENPASGGQVSDPGPFLMGDQDGDYTSLAYRVTATYGNGVVANDNLGDPSSPEIKIAAGSVNKTSSAITPYRKYFYGSLTDSHSSADSALIRGLTGSSTAASNGQTFSIPVVEGAKTVIIAYPETLRDLTSVLDQNAFGTDIVASFVKSTVSVEGANGYTGINYKVFMYTPDAALGANTYNVTI